MKHYVLEDFSEMDSLYRLVNIAYRRANQVTKPETRALVPILSKKPTIVALEEILDGKIGFVAGNEAQDDYEVS